MEAFELVLYQLKSSDLSFLSLTRTVFHGGRLVCALCSFSVAFCVREFLHPQIIGHLLHDVIGDWSGVKKVLS